MLMRAQSYVVVYLSPLEIGHALLVLSVNAFQCYVNAFAFLSEFAVTVKIGVELFDFFVIFCLWTVRLDK